MGSKGGNSQRRCSEGKLEHKGIPFRDAAFMLSSKAKNAVIPLRLR